MAVAVGAGEEGGVARSSAGVGIVVVAVGEVCAVIEEQAEPSVGKLVAIAFEIIGSELVDDDYDDQFGTGVVGGGGGRNCGQRQGGYEGKREALACSKGAEGGFHRKGSLHRVASGIRQHFVV